jgi:predicted homoserine dehydrogenase-like protein
LDGEGGYTVWGRLLPAEESLRCSALPIGLAHHIQVRRAIRAGDILTYNDVAVDESSECFRIRREMELTFANAASADLPAA